MRIFFSVLIAVRSPTNQLLDSAGGSKNLTNVLSFGFGVINETTTIVIAELATITTTGIIS